MSTDSTQVTLVSHKWYNFKTCVLSCTWNVSPHWLRLFILRRPCSFDFCAPPKAIGTCTPVESFKTNMTSYLQYKPLIPWSFLAKYSQKTLHISSVRARYGVSFMSSESDLYLTFLSPLHHIRCHVIIDRVIKRFDSIYNVFRYVMIYHGFKWTNIFE